MNNRIYNILFHTHTISGIIISAVLYVIFFAGSFSFFRDEIVNWERNHIVKTSDASQIDFNKALDSLEKSYTLYGRDIAFNQYYQEQRIGTDVSASKDTLNKDTQNSAFFYLDTKNFTKHKYNDSYSLGEFLYRLHFLAQIPYPYGYYLSGFTAFFFLFASITGLLVHWDKIIKNFYVFRPWAKLKTLWTDAHTALGLIGFPFQLVYAVTGAFFMIKVVLIAPTVMTLFNGDQEKFYTDLGYEHEYYEFKNIPAQEKYDINKYVKQTKLMWEGFNITQVHIFNYGDKNMHLLLEGNLNYNNKLNGLGEATYKLSTGELIAKKDPSEPTSYLAGVKNILYRIHYGDYGGYPLKIISFLLGIITCFVIISGVMIWLVARDRKNIPEKKRRFNEWLVNIYLAVCLSMYPITAATFIAVKVVNFAGKSFIYNFYFIGWLLLSVFFIIKKDNFFTNKTSLLLGSILGFLIPVINGIVTGNWFWKTFINQEIQLFFVDIFWIILASLTLWVAFKLKSKHEK